MFLYNAHQKHGVAYEKHNKAKNERKTKHTKYDKKDDLKLETRPARRGIISFEHSQDCTKRRLSFPKEELVVSLRLRERGYSRGIFYPI